MAGRCYILLTSVFLLISSRSYAQPKITSFSPASGPAGSTVTITGSNFNATPGSNFVYFGPVRGGVMAGTTSTLTVNVPGGISNQPVSVFDFSSRLTGFANKPYVMTFNGNPVFTPASFSPKRDFTAGANVYGIAVADITIDQKPDIVVANGSGLSFTVMQNMSATATPNFTSVSFPVAATGYLTGIVSADFDGDGRKDVAVTNLHTDQLVVFRNETPGAGPVAFGTKSEFTTGDQPYALITADFDLDGKIDIAVSNQMSNTISVFRNVTTTTVIAFAPKVDFAAGTEVRGLAAADLDDDGKADVVACNQASGQLSVLKNTTSGNTISFAGKMDINAGDSPESVAIGDLDGDGKPDIATANNGPGAVSIFRNTSSSGAISFSPKLDISSATNPFSITIADLNGDGKQDIGVANQASNDISVFSNTSTSGAISFQPKQDYATNQKPRSFLVADFDLDGRMDLAAGNNETNQVSVLMNNVTNAPPCAATASLSGTQCIGSVLNVNSNMPVNSVSWLLNGNVVAVHKAGLQTASTLVAGGNGSGTGLNQLFAPNRLFVDKDGVMYIPDMENNRVMKWLPGATSGTVVAGGNGPGNQANQLNRPTCVTVDAAGNIYVADQNNNRIQKWTPGASSGTTVASSLATPTGIFIDARNDLYVAEQNSNRVLKFAPGTLTGVVVAGGNGPGSAANQLESPTGLFVDAAGALFVCDTDNRRIQKWAPGASSGVTVAEGPGLANPLGVYVDPEGNLYASDFTNRNVQKWAPGASSGTIVINGSSNMGAVQPVGVWMDSNNSLYITDFTGHRVLRFENIFTGSYTVLKAGTYSAQVASSAGCAITTNAIIVSENPAADVKVSSSSSIICPAITPVFTVNVTGATPVPLFQWKINGVNSGPPSANATFSPTGLKIGDKVTCDASLVNSCGSIYQASGNVITMTDVPQTAPTLTITTGSAEFCAGTEITFTSAASNAGASPSYQWMLNGKAIPGATSATYLTKLLVNGDRITCEIVSNEQCQANARALSNEVAVKVNPIVDPEIVIRSDATVIYEGSTVTFNATVKNGGTSPGFDWQLNGKSVAFNMASFTAEDLKEGDEISCILTSNAPCAGAAMVSSNSIIINISPVLTVTPPTVFTPNGDAVNDIWEIPGISAFPNNQVEIFNQYGVKIFNSRGYKTPWNGEFNGAALPVGVYYYVVRLDDKTRVAGNVTILR